jgi:hypothetical protein
VKEENLIIWRRILYRVVGRRTNWYKEFWKYNERGKTEI